MFAGFNDASWALELPIEYLQLDRLRFGPEVSEVLPNRDNDNPSLTLREILVRRVSSNG